MPNASDDILDGVVTHTINLLRVAAGQRKEVLAMLEKLEGQLLVELQNTVGKSAFTAARLKALLSQTSATIKGAYETIAKNQGTALSKIAALEATKITNVTNKALGVAINTVGMSPEQLAAIAGKTLVNGKYPAEHWKDQEKTLTNKFAVAMREGMLKGEGIDKLAQRVRGTKAKAYTDGMMIASKAQAAALVRTSVLTTANQASIDTMLNNLDTIKGIQWVSTLDNRTTTICKALDGLEWALPGFKPVGHDKVFPGPTAHWNCRSRQIPVTKSWKELAGPKAKFKTPDGKSGNIEQLMQEKLIAMGMSPEQAAKYKANTQASMDGQVAAKLTFEDWLKTKTPDFQDEVLGPQRATLWRNGEATIAEMTDQDNRPLTLAELKALISANVNVAPAKEGENGLTLLERKLLEASMVSGVESQTVLTHYVDGATGERVTITGTSPTAADLDKIKGFKKLTVLQNSIDTGEVWGPQQLGLFGHLPGFDKATIVGPSGKLFTASVKAGETFDTPAADDVAAKFKALKNTTAIPGRQDKFAKAAADNGKLKTKSSATGAVKVPPKTYNQTFPFGQQPAPFFDPEADALKKAADAAQKAAQQAAEAKAKADAEAALAARAEKVAANAEATAARQAANKALVAKEAAEAKAAQLAAELVKANEAAQAEIAAVLDDPKGKTLLAKNLSKGMKESPSMGAAELLAKAKAQAVMDQAKASQAAALSGYKAKALEGKDPTPAQLKALEGLDPDGKAKFLASIEAAKMAAAKKKADEEAKAAAEKAAATAAVADSKPVVPVPADQKPLPKPKGFPTDPANLKVVNANIGGSTGAQLVQDADGNKYVRKSGASPDHIREEAFADAVYAGLGVKVPEFQIYETPTGPVKLAKFVEGQQLGTWLKTAKPAEKAKVLEKLRNGFAADALLGNWDVAGANNDNIIVTPDGEPIRIDNGGSLRFRATGPRKTPDQWNDFATELWTMRGLQLSERDAGKGQSNSSALFGEMTIYDIARQVKTMDPGAFASAPPEVRQTLERRLAHMKVLATRALDYESSGWLPQIPDKVARHSMGYRENGVVARMSKSMTSTGTVMLVDENGKLFDELRSKTSGQSAPVNASDPFGPTFFNAIVSINAANKNGAMKFANDTKVTAVLAMEKTISDWANSTDPAKKAVGAHYTEWLAKIKGAQTAFKPGQKASTDPLPKFDTDAGTKLSVAQKNPQLVQPPKPNQSLTADVSDYISGEVKDGAKFVRDWMSGQARSSWDANALPIKYWAGKAHGDTDKFWWGANGINESKAQYDAMAAKVGGPDKLDTIFAAWAAYTQEVLTNTALPNKDDDRRLVRLIRTELKGVFNDAKIPVGQYGGVHTLLKGAAESHSLMTITRVFGEETTVTAVPFTEIFGVYLTEKPGYGSTPGTGGAGFCGDGENEFVCSTSGLPFVYAGKASGTGGPLADGSAYWKKQLEPGHDAGPDASKWGVPIDWWKP